MRVTVLYKPGHVRHRLVATLLALATSGCAGPSRSADAENSPVPSVDTGSPHQVAPMKLRITIEDAVLTANLEDNAATRDFVSLLPLTLTLRDHAGTEKVSDLPRRLSTKGALPGVDPEVADIAYYAPWGNLAIYYRDFGYSTGLVRLGRIGNREAGEGSRGPHGPPRARAGGSASEGALKAEDGPTASGATSALRKVKREVSDEHCER